MQLIEVNKTRYRKHLNRVIAACITCLAIGSLLISQILIAILPDESGSHFHWNLAGVVVSCIVIFILLNKYRKHEFMTEVVYVWELKQALNKITRKMRQLKTAANEGNVDAMIAMHYSYAGSRLLWQLDDNTIIMDELVIAQAELESLAAQYQLTLSSDSYHDGMLTQF